MENLSPQQPLTKFCTICQKDIENHQTTRVFTCLHSVDNDCYSDAIRYAEKFGQDFNCPCCRYPVMTSVHIPSAQELQELWAITKQHPDRITRIPNELIRGRCLAFASFFRENRVTHVNESNFLLPLFVDSINACFVMPRLEAILAQRSCLDTQLTIALAKVNLFEKENPTIAKLGSAVITQSFAQRDTDKKLETITQKLTNKKNKLQKSRQLNGTLVQNSLHAIQAKTRLRLGLTICTSIMTGFCIRKLLASDDSPATKSGIAAALAVAVIGSSRTIQSAVKEKQELEKILS